MKERPILFSAPMVRAILDGRKTQTRRIVKNIGIVPGIGEILKGSDDIKEWPELCPYGKPGDRLWVRETFKQHDEVISYKADGTWITDFQHTGGINPHENITWIPSIHMPRNASRILLEITGVRVERLQDISECDAKAEGSYVCDYFGRRLLDQSSNQGCYKWGYRSIWESLNGTGSWDLNPFVWVIEFKLLEVRK